jgi:hypothetical protein
MQAAWEQPNDADELMIAKVVTKYVVFLDPMLVWRIAKDNQRRADRWRRLLEARGIDSRLYLWEGSPCGFPGVRRYRGVQEKTWYEAKGKSLCKQTFPDAAVIDWNGYPKKLWNYLSGERIHGYSLTHLLNPTKITTQFWADLSANTHLEDKGLYGLFTSPANTIYVPNSMLNFIGTIQKLKGLLVERELQLYQQVCRIVPPEVQVYTDRQYRNNDWDIDRFEWAPCFGAGVSLEEFLNYREKTVESLFKSYKLGVTREENACNL